MSKASVSTELRQMEQHGFVERVPSPGTREHYHQVKGGGDASRMIQGRVALLEYGREVAELGLAAVGEDPERRERLEEMLDIYAFMAREFEGTLMERWRAYREARRRQRREARRDH